MTDREQESRNVIYDAIFGVLEKRLEDVIRLDLNEFDDSLTFNILVAQVTDAVLAAHRPTEPDEDVREALADAIESVSVYIPGSHGHDYINPNHAADAIRARFHVAPHGTEPDEDNWEYGLVSPDATPGQYGPHDTAHLVSRSREHIERQQRRGHPSIQAVQRRPAGSWEPVTPRGEQP